MGHGPVFEDHHSRAFLSQTLQSSWISFESCYSAGYGSVGLAQGLSPWHSDRPPGDAAAGPRVTLWVAKLWPKASFSTQFSDILHREDGRPGRFAVVPWGSAYSLDHSVAGRDRRAQGCFGIQPAAICQDVWTCPWQSSIVNRKLYCKGSQFAWRSNKVILIPSHTIESPKELLKHLLIPRPLPHNSELIDWRWEANRGLLKSFASDCPAQPALRTTKHHRWQPYRSFNFFFIFG